MKGSTTNFEEIDINTYKGGVPTGKELVVAEKGNEESTAMVLYGFDEIGEFEEEIKCPVYGFM